ncbi:hypothetical protein H310_14074 [Aphanomyces invadans]|uniref:DDE Tnp4 domain-containing protein n=1 Tax=Aphanomyces invadans TaxID=157072 RepID=A0A024TDN2_9STRA|nr:hypothetical protein H310_14074 [Aphanomyces invadans]ETV91407.1 hypothetical protein H310_14074 [Aphanomyces invadans]|eukprot:XP_008880035.1 hypothetical protein H310_14074 [Aphanomyces invadans]
MSTKFGRSRSSLCEIFLHVINELYDRWGSLLYLNKKLLAQNMDRYCDAVTAKGALLSNLFGFIDGTKLQTCRISSTGSGENLQRQVYSGHKRIHCLNYQAVTAPDGICLYFFGPVEGRRHLMEQFANDRSFLKGNSLTAERQEFNKWMSRVRQSVEWNFKMLKSLWAIITFKTLSKIRLSPVVIVVAVAMLLTNCHCCHFEGNQISQFFGLKPPTVREYLDTLEKIDI